MESSWEIIGGTFVGKTRKCTHGCFTRIIGPIIVLIVIIFF